MVSTVSAWFVLVVFYHRSNVYPALQVMVLVNKRRDRSMLCVLSHVNNAIELYWSLIVERYSKALRAYSGRPGCIEVLLLSIIIIFFFFKRRKIVKSSKCAAYFLYKQNCAEQNIDSGMVGTKWLGLRKEFKISLGLRQLNTSKKSNAACFYTPIVLKLLIVVQMWKQHEEVN